MPPRNHIGNRTHLANVYRHNGNVDAAGQPTYGVDADWNLFIRGWHVELLTSGGDESIRGRQTSASTTHVLYGEFFGGAGIQPTDKIVIDGTTYNITAAVDEDGLNFEQRVEVAQSYGNAG